MIARHILRGFWWVIIALDAFIVILYLLMYIRPMIVLELLHKIGVF